MNNEEFIRLLNLAKIKENDLYASRLKDGTERLISETEKILGFSFSGKDFKENVCTLREDRQATSVSRADILKNTKDSDKEFFLLKERSEDS